MMVWQHFNINALNKMHSNKLKPKFSKMTNKGSKIIHKTIKDDLCLVYQVHPNIPISYLSTKSAKQFYLCNTSVLSKAHAIIRSTTITKVNTVCASI